MAFDKKKESAEETAPATQLEKEFAQAANIANEDAPLAEVNVVKEDVVRAAAFDPEALVTIVPRLAATPGGSMPFRIGDRHYIITDNKRIRVPLDVAIQLREKGYCAGF